MSMELKQHKALLYAEKYGIVKYIVKGNTMVYYVNYPQYLKSKAYTIKATVNLNTMKETRQQLKRYRS